jgi:hypothetical protein
VGGDAPAPGNQAELEFRCYHWPPAGFLKADHNGGEDVAGISHVGTAIGVEHGQHHLSVLALG